MTKIDLDIIILIFFLLLGYASANLAGEISPAQALISAGATGRCGDSTVTACSDTGLSRYETSAAASRGSENKYL